MTTLQAIIIAIVEGITEFLPISSTAHMKFTNPLIGVDGNSPFAEMFEVIIQLAAILSVVLVYRKKFFDFKHYSFYIKLLVAVMPALVVGALLKKHIDAALSNLIFIACIMIAGGVVLLFIDKWMNKTTLDNETEITYPKAFTIGCFQVLSIIFPGLSRSASTIIGGMQQKLTRRLAAEFSFFLAVPTMFAASVKSFLDAMKENYLVAHNITEEQAKSMHLSMTHDIFGSENFHSLFNHHNLVVFIIGCLISFFIALIAVKTFINYLSKHGFRVFGIYRIIIGAVMLGLIFGMHLGQ